MIEVWAGIMPGEPMPDYSRCWSETNAQQDHLAASDPEARLEYLRMAGESREYAVWLEDPWWINWVRRDWSWC
jgi:hypothetical protein